VELTAGNGDRIQLFGPGQRYFEFYRSHGDSIVPLLKVDDLDQARPSWPAAAPSYSASGSQTAPGPGSPSGRPTGTSTAWAPAWRSWQARRLWSNALDMRHERALRSTAGRIFYVSDLPIAVSLPRSGNLSEVLTEHYRRAPSRGARPAFGGSRSRTPALSADALQGACRLGCQGWAKRNAGRSGEVR
jgi:hypothetical protein